MAWATAMLSFADGSEDLLSRQTFSGNFLNRFEIIPNDGLGFTPGQTLTLQMFDRSAPLRGFPFPPSSVSLDGQALSSPYLNDEITIAPSLILRIEDLAGNLLADTFPNSTPVTITTPPPFKIITENAVGYGLLARPPGEVFIYDPVYKVAPDPDDGVDSFIQADGSQNVYFAQPGPQIVAIGPTIESFGVDIIGQVHDYVHLDIQPPVQPLTLMLPTQSLQTFLQQQATCCYVELDTDGNCPVPPVPGIQTGQTPWTLIPGEPGLSFPFLPDVPGKWADFVDWPGVHIDLDQICLKIDQDPAKTFVSYAPGTQTITLQVGGPGIDLMRGGASGFLCFDETCTPGAPCPLYTATYTVRVTMVPVVEDNRFRLSKTVEVDLDLDHIAAPCLPNDLVDVIVGLIDTSLVGYLDDMFQGYVEGKVEGKIRTLDHTLLNYVTSLVEWDPMAGEEKWLRYRAFKDDFLKVEGQAYYCGLDQIHVDGISAAGPVGTDSESFPRPLGWLGESIRFTLNARPNLLVPATPEMETLLLYGPLGFSAVEGDPDWETYDDHCSVPLGTGP